MFDVDYSELLLIAIVALVVIGPKDLPRVMRTVGHWVGRARGMARHFRSGIDTMIREAELEEMDKKWREENERILKAHPLAGPLDEMLPLAGPAAADPAAHPAPPPADGVPDWVSPVPAPGESPAPPPAPPAPDERGEPS